MQVTSSVRQPLVTGGKTYHDVTHDVCRHVEAKPTKLWYLAFLTAASVLGLGSIAHFGYSLGRDRHVGP